MIVDAVAGGAVQPDVSSARSEDGPREYVEAITGAQIQVPERGKRHAVLGRTAFETQGGVNVMPALADLIEQGKFKVRL